MSSGREITATGIFVYLYYPGMRIRMLIRSTRGLFLVLPCLYMWYGDAYLFLRLSRIVHNGALFYL